LSQKLQSQNKPKKKQEAQQSLNWAWLLGHQTNHFLHGSHGMTPQNPSEFKHKIQTLMRDMASHRRGQTLGKDICYYMARWA